MMRMNRDIRDVILVFRFPLWLNVSSFSSKKIHDGDCFASLMIPLFAKNSRLGYFFNANNQSKFHFDFEDDLPQGSRRLWLLIPFLAKNSRLGYFFYANNLLNDATEFITTLRSFL